MSTKDPYPLATALNVAVLADLVPFPMIAEACRIAGWEDSPLCRSNVYSRDDDQTCEEAGCCLGASTPPDAVA